MRTCFTSAICSLLLVMLGSCAKETTQSVNAETILTAEGPLFEGSNTIQGDINNPGDLLKSLNIHTEQLASATVKTVTLSVDDSTDFDQFSNITLQFVSEKTDMVKVALINPVPTGKHEVQMTVATEQTDLSELFAQDKFTVVADAILKKDSEAGVTLKTKLEFLLTIKK